MKPEHEKILDAFLEALFFENWLRYNFLENTREGADEIVKLRIPERDWELIRRKYPHLEELAAALDGKATEFETARQTLLHYLAALIARRHLAPETAATIVEAPRLAKELEQLHCWLNMQPLELPQLEFDAWIGLFQDWKNSQPQEH